METSPAGAAPPELTMTRRCNISGKSRPGFEKTQYNPLDINLQQPGNTKGKGERRSSFERKQSL